MPATDLRGSAFSSAATFVGIVLLGARLTKNGAVNFSFAMWSTKMCDSKELALARLLEEERRKNVRIAARGRKWPEGSPSGVQAAKEIPRLIVPTAAQSSDRAVDEEPVLIRTSTRPSRLSCGSPKAPVCIFEAGTPAASRAL